MKSIAIRSVRGEGNKTIEVAGSTRTRWSRRAGRTAISRSRRWTTPPI
jgi:hypothetical protein